MAVFEVRECATLGTNFSDVYRDGELFARELSRPIAESFVQDPMLYGNAFADTPKLRTWIIENFDKFVQEHNEQSTKMVRE